MLCWCLQQRLWLLRQRWLLRTRHNTLHFLESMPVVMLGATVFVSRFGLILSCFWSREKWIHWRKFDSGERLPLWFHFKLGPLFQKCQRTFLMIHQVKISEPLFWYHLHGCTKLFIWSWIALLRWFLILLNCVNDKSLVITNLLPFEYINGWSLFRILSNFFLRKIG